MKTIDLARPIGRHYRGLWLVFAMIGLHGCQPVKRLNVDNATLANREALACMERIAKNPANRDVAIHLPLDGKDPTPAQLADGALPTATEAQTLRVIHQDVISCREKTLANFSLISPEAIPVAKDGYRESDEVVEQLVNRKISWGEANHRKSAIRASLVEKLQAIQNRSLGSP